MKLGMVAIHCHVMVDCGGNSFFHPWWVRKRFPVASAAMVFSEPNVRHAFFRPELGCVVHLCAFIQLRSVLRRDRHDGKAATNSVDVLASPAFVKRNHLGCWIHGGHSGMIGVTGGRMTMHTKYNQGVV